MADPKIEPIFLSTGDAAAFLGVGRSAFYQHFLTPHRLPTVRIGKRTLVHRADLEKLADDLRAEAAEEASRHGDTAAAMVEEARSWGGSDTEGRAS